VQEEYGYDEVVKTEIEPEQLSGLEIKEEISFNKKAFRFESKIIYAAILIYPINLNTGLKDVNGAQEILYWVKFKD
jgi:hypothetical protein